MAAQQLHDEIQHAAGLAEVVDVDNVRLTESAREPRLAQEPFDRRSIVGQFRVNDFDRDLAIDRQLPTAIHRAHAALAERRANLVALVEHAGREVTLKVMLDISSVTNRVNIGGIDQPVIGRSLKPSERATAAVGYVRLHGRRYDTWFTDDPLSPPEERYNHLYSAEELEPWAQRIEKVRERAGTTFVITNNHFQGKAIVNALQLLSILRGTKVKVPEPLRHRYPQLDAIADEPAQEPTLFPNPPR